MGLVNAEVMNNMGLCCFYSQQFDVTFSCFKRALALADSEAAANVWYNLSHVAMVGFFFFLNLHRKKALMTFLLIEKVIQFASQL